MIAKYLNLIDKKNFKSLYLFLFLTLISIFFEFISISLVPLFVSILLDPQNNQLLNIPYFKIFSGFEKYYSKNNILFFASLLIAGFVIKNLITLFTIVYEANIHSKLKRAVMRNLYKKYLYMPYENIKRYNVSTILRNIEPEVTKLFQSFFSILKFIKDFTLFILLIFLLLIWNLKATVFTFAFLGTCFLFYYFALKKKIDFYGKNQIEYKDKFFRWVIQTVNFIGNIHLNKLETYFENIFKNYNLKLEKTIRFNKIAIALPAIFFEVLLILLICIGSIFYFKKGNHNDLVFLSLLVVSLIRLLPIMVRFSSLYGSLYFNLPALNLINNELKKNFNKDKKNNLIKNLQFNKSLRFKNINFSYQDSKYKSIRNINLNLSKKKIIGIVGQSGSGKTTLVNIISGLLIPNSGSIFVDNKKINYKKNLYSFQKNISFLTQKSYLFDDNILNNITLNQKVDKKKLNFVLNFVNFKKRFKNKNLESQVGMDGAYLSGGQIQTIAFARSLYKNFDILILDEFSNNLDQAFEKELLKKIKFLKTKNKKTIIMVTHNFNSLKICDEIIVISGGAIKEKLNYKKFFSKYILI